MEYVFIVVAILQSNAFKMVEAKPNMERDACLDLVVEYNKELSRQGTFALCTSFPEEEKIYGEEKRNG